MLHHTRGIFFHQVRYSETSLIVKIYTEAFGLQTYMIRGIRSKKSAIKPAHLQHLTLLDMVVYHRENKDIQNIKELRTAFHFNSIPFDIRKSSVVVFLNEVLYNVIREHESNPGLFQFIFDELLRLDGTVKDIAVFHLQFLVRLTRFLGFFPRNNYSILKPVFDLQEGVFTDRALHPLLFMEEPLSRWFSLLSSDEIISLRLSTGERNQLLEYILRYYTVHLPGMKPVKSHVVLQSVMNG
jgi:DNA repair protein RecO (recombination protein O)